MHKEPASSVIRKLGGVTKTASLLNVDQSTVLRWRMPKESKGTGGYIPNRYLFQVWQTLRCAGSATRFEELIFTADQIRDLEELSQTETPVSSHNSAEIMR